MIRGIGVDVVDLARFERSLDRTPALRDRLFAPSEQADGERVLTARSLAARFAAKEALIKALGESGGVRWHDLRVIADDHGAPALALSGAAEEIARRRGVDRLHLTMSHDAGIAIAWVVAEASA